MTRNIWKTKEGTTKSLLYRTNSCPTEYTMTAWYFGKTFTDESAAEAKRQHRKTGEKKFRFWQEGTGYLTIEII